MPSKFGQLNTGSIGSLLNLSQIRAYSARWKVSEVSRLLAPGTSINGHSDEVANDHPLPPFATLGKRWRSLPDGRCARFAGGLHLVPPAVAVGLDD